MVLNSTLNQKIVLVFYFLSVSNVLSVQSIEKLSQALMLLTQQDAKFEKIVDCMRNNNDDCSNLLDFTLVNYQDEHGMTALHHAAKIGNLKACRVLLDKGALVNARDSKGRTSLLLSQNAQVIQLLLDNQANVNAQDHDGNTILHLLSTWWSPDQLKVVFAYNPNVALKNKQGKTALHILYVNDLIKTFEVQNSGDQKPKKSEGPIEHFVQDSKNIPLIIDLHDEDNPGYTLLHEFAKQGMIQSLQKTLDYYRKTQKLEKIINVQDSLGNTPLHYASLKNEFKVAEILLKSGADKTIKNKKGRISLDRAKEKLEQGAGEYKKLVQLLQNS